MAKFRVISITTWLLLLIVVIGLFAGIMVVKYIGPAAATVLFEHETVDFPNDIQNMTSDLRRGLDALHYDLAGLKVQENIIQEREFLQDFRQKRRRVSGCPTAG